MKRSEPMHAFAGKHVRACPFCAGRRISRLRLLGLHALDPTSDDPDGFAYHCDGCGISGPEGKTIAEARQLWNRRPRKETSRTKMVKITH